MVTVAITITVMMLLNNGERHRTIYKIGYFDPDVGGSFFSNILVATPNPRMIDRFLPVTFAFGIPLSLCV